MGNWETPIPLAWKDGHYEGCVSIHTKPFEFKAVVMQGDAIVSWEPGENRYVCWRDFHDTLLLTAVFGVPEIGMKRSASDMSHVQPEMRRVES